MQLTQQTIPAFLRLQHPALDPTTFAEQCEKWAKRGDLAHVRVALDGPDVVAAVRLFEPFAGHFSLLTPKAKPGAEHHLGDLAAEAMQTAKSQGVRRLHTRLQRDPVPSTYLQALSQLGFEERGARVEFKTPVSELPSEEGTPLRFEPYTAGGLVAAGALFERAGAGPEWEDTDVGVDLITGYLAKDGMYAEPDCVQIGRLDGVPMSIVIAQAERSTGWCTITFMGIVSEYRGKGLGMWLHRRGMAMMRAQGGTLYHGGTSTSNTSMIRLFHKHGCRIHAHFVQLSARL